MVLTHKKPRRVRHSRQTKGKKLKSRKHHIKTRRNKGKKQKGGKEVIRMAGLDAALSTEPYGATPIANLLLVAGTATTPI